MIHKQFETMSQSIILHNGADGEVAHLLSKLLEHDAAQRKEIARLRTTLQTIQTMCNPHSSVLARDIAVMIQRALKETAT